jgi:hypothetical protein
MSFHNPWRASAIGSVIASSKGPSIGTGTAGHLGCGFLSQSLHASTARAWHSASRAAGIDRFDQVFAVVRKDGRRSRRLLVDATSERVVLESYRQRLSGVLFASGTCLIVEPFIVYTLFRNCPPWPSGSR